MKKKTLALFGAVAFAGVALASCGKKNGGNNNGGEEAAGRVHVEDKVLTGADNSSGVCKWEPITFDQAKAKYNLDANDQIDAWIVYSQKYGVTYNKVLGSYTTTNPIDGISYSEGDTLPAWKAFASKLGIKKIEQGAAYGAKDDANYTNFIAAKKEGKYIDKNNNVTDIFYNTTTNLNKLGDADELVDLTTYINNGSMPALKKFLDDNPEVKSEITHNNKIFYSPYMDGYQAIERNYNMDTEQVEKLLDNALPTGTGLLAAGKDGNAKGLHSEPKATQYLGSEGKNYDKNINIDIVNPKTNAKVSVTVKQTDNIITQQNELLAKGCTGKDLIDQFKTYANAAYGDIITNYYDGKISKMFTSVGACYNADDLVALLRIFKANPDVLYGSADLYDEVVPVFPRGQADNRVETILNFGSALYGVQGRGSEYEHLFFGADGKLHDFDTANASYDMLEKLHLLYSEGLIQTNFWSGSQGTAGLDNYFKKIGEKSSSYGLLIYDYIATQSAGNDIQNGVGTKADDRKTSASGYNFNEVSVQGIKAILAPLTYVSTEDFKYDQSLDNNTGKTICRYYEENRAVKNTTWAIPKSSDNIDAAIALMDFLFTKEGWQIQNFGPEGYWDEGTIGGESCPILKQAILNHYAGASLDFWNYCRGFLGTTQAVGHYRPWTLDYQATNYYGRKAYSDLVLAANLGVQMTNRSIANVTQANWHSAMPMAVFTPVSEENAKAYSGVTTFWAQKNKASSDGTLNGWVAIVASGSDYDKNVLSSVNGKDYKYSDVKDERAKKNEIYLYQHGNTLGMIPTEAKKS